MKKKEIYELMFEAIDYTLKKSWGYIKEGYEVNFLYPSDNIAYQKLLKAREKYLKNKSKNIKKL